MKKIVVPLLVASLTPYSCTGQAHEVALNALRAEPSEIQASQTCAALLKLVLSKPNSFEFNGFALSPGIQFKADDIRFIAPNEPHALLNKATLENATGTLVSVGTFRSFFDFGFGKFSHLTLLDYNPAVVKFNQLLIKTIGQSANHGEFLDLLRSGAVFRELEKLPGLHDTTGVLTGRGEFAGLLEFLNANETRALRNQSFLGNEEIFNRVQRAVREGRVRTAYLSLTNPQGMKDLSREMKNQGETVSWINVSNVPDYWGNEFRPRWAKDPRDRLRQSALLAQSIGALQKDHPKLQVLFTSETAGSTAELEKIDIARLPSTLQEKAAKQLNGVDMRPDLEPNKFTHHSAGAGDVVRALTPPLFLLPQSSLTRQYQHMLMHKSKLLGVDQP